MLQKDEFNGEEFAEYSDDPQLEPSERKPFLASILKVGALSVAAVLGTTFAANININSGGNGEFGQGVSIATACSGSESISIKPSSAFDSTQSKFKINKFVLANIPANCLDKDFLISIYSDVSVISLDTGVDTARVVYKGAQTTQVYSGLSGTNTFGASLCTCQNEPAWIRQLRSPTVSSSHGPPR
jgi:hypothetical protein